MKNVYVFRNFWLVKIIFYNFSPFCGNVEVYKLYMLHAMRSSIRMIYFWIQGIMVQLLVFSSLVPMGISKYVPKYKLFFHKILWYKCTKFESNW